MNDDALPNVPGMQDKDEPSLPSRGRPDHTIGSSTIYRLCEEMIALREKSSREHKVFEQKLKETRDALQSTFNSFAADTQRAYQQLRQELHGEKRVSLALLNELIEVAFDLKHIVAARPRADDAEAVARWADAVEVESRKVQAALLRHGIQPYDAVIGSEYKPALHERVGSRPEEGMGPLRIVEQREQGLASQQPEFVLRRPKVVVSE